MKKIKIKNKRGDVTEFILLLVVFFFVAVAFLIVGFVNDQMKSVITDSDLNSTAVATAVTDEMTFITSTTIQRAFVFLFAFFLIGMMVSAFLVKVHPIFIFIYIIFLAVSVFLSVFLSNAYETIRSVEALATVGDQQTMTNWIWSHIVGIEIAAGALSIIITFSKVLSPEGVSRV